MQCALCGNNYAEVNLGEGGHQSIESCHLDVKMFRTAEGLRARHGHNFDTAATGGPITK